MITIHLAINHYLFLIEIRVAEKRSVVDVQHITVFCHYSAFTQIFKIFTGQRKYIIVRI